MKICKYKKNHESITFNVYVFPKYSQKLNSTFVRYGFQNINFRFEMFSNNCQEKIAEQH